MNTSMPFRRSNAAITIVALVLGMSPVLPTFVPRAFAAGIVWDGSFSTDWNDGQNWVGDSVPGPGDDVEIPSGTPVFPILTDNVTVSSLVIRDSASLTTDGYDLTVTGSFDNQGALYFNGLTDFPTDTDSGTCVVTAAASLDDFAPKCFNLDITDASIANTVTVNGSLSMRGGTLLPGTPNSTLTVAGDFFLYSGSVSMDSSNSSSYLLEANVGGDMDFAIGTGTMDFNSSHAELTVGGDLRLRSGAFAHSSLAVVSVGGNVTDAGATAESLTLTGCDQTVEKGWTVVNFTKTTADGCALTLGSGETFVVSGTLTLSGDGDSQLAIGSTVDFDASVFNLVTGATVAAHYLTVSDNYVIRDGGGIGTPISPDHSVDVPFHINYGWFDDTIRLVAGGGESGWDNPNNWSPPLVPGATDSVIVVAGFYSSVQLESDVTVGELTIESGIAVDLNGYDLSVNGALSNQGTIVFSGNESVSFGTPDADSGTCEYGGAVTRNSITDCFNATITGTISLPDGNSTTVPGDLVVDAGAALIVADTSASHLINVSGSMTVEGALQTYTNGVHVDGDLAVTGAGTFRTGQNSSRSTLVGGDLTQDGGTIVVERPSGPGIAVGGSVALHGGTFDFDTDATLDVDGDVTIDGGSTANGDAATLVIGGDFAHTGGTFDVHTTTLDGCNQAISGESTFNVLQKTVVGGPCTLTLQAGQKQTVTTTLQFDEDTGNELYINSSVPGVAAVFDLVGSAIFTGDFLFIQDNTVLRNGGTTYPLLQPLNSHESAGGNTYGWFDADVSWNGSFNTDWDTAVNWTPAIVPGSTDSVTIANVANDPVLSGNVSVEDLTIQEGAVLDQNGHGLTVNGTFENDDGELVLSAAVGTFPSDIDSGTCTLTGLADGGLARTVIEDCFNVRINALGVVWQINTNSNVRGDFTISAGTWLFQNGPNTIGGDLVLDGGAVDTFGGSPTIEGDLRMSAGSISGLSAAGLTVLGDVDLSGGTLDARSLVLLFGGDFIATGGTFTGGGNIALTGCHQTIDVSSLGGGSILFDDMTMVDEDDDATQCSLTIAEGTTLNVEGLLTLSGFDDGADMDDLLVIQSDVPGSEATIHFENGGTFVGSHLSVVDNILTDANSTTILPLNPDYSENRGNTVGWFPLPDPPTSAPDLQASSDTGTSDTDDVTADRTPTFTVNCSNGATVTLASDLDGDVGSLVCTSDADQSITASTLTEGEHSMTLTFATTAGESDPSPSLALTIDASAPSTPATPDLTVGSDTGTADSDNVTNDTTPTFTVGSCEDGATVTVSGATVTASAVCAGGTATVTLGAVPANGTRGFKARQADPAGNASAWSAALSVTIDTLAPSAPVITAPTDGQVVNTPTAVRGNCVSGSVVHVTNALLSSNPTNGSCGGGNTFSIGVDWEDGAAGTSQTLTVTQEDAAGNVSGDDTVVVDVSFDVSVSVHEDARVEASSDGAVDAGGRRGRSPLPSERITPSSPETHASAVVDVRTILQGTGDRSVSGHDAALVIESLRGRGECSGRRTLSRASPETLRRPITRGALFRGIAEALCLRAEPGARTRFVDLDPTSSFYSSIVALERRSIVQGYRTVSGEPTGAVGPYRSVSVGELRVIIARLRRIGFVY